MEDLRMFQMLRTYGELFPLRRRREGCLMDQYDALAESDAIGRRSVKPLPTGANR
jgi:hypothetical protein